MIRTRIMKIMKRMRILKKMRIMRRMKKVLFTYDDPSTFSEMRKIRKTRINESCEKNYNNDKNENIEK